METIGKRWLKKAYLFKELYIETIMRNPKKVGPFGYR